MIDAWIENGHASRIMYQKGLLVNGETGESVSSGTNSTNTTGELLTPYVMRYVRKGVSGNYKGTLKFKSGLQNQSPLSFLFNFQTLRGPLKSGGCGALRRHWYIHRNLNVGYYWCVSLSCNDRVGKKYWKIQFFQIISLVLLFWCYHHFVM